MHPFLCFHYWWINSSHWVKQIMCQTFDPGVMASKYKISTSLLTHPQSSLTTQFSLLAHAVWWEKGKRRESSSLLPSLCKIYKLTTIPILYNFPNSRQRDKKNRIQRPNFVESRFPSRYFRFSRIPHRILAKSRIPKIPFQTLCYGLPKITKFTNLTIFR